MSQTLIHKRTLQPFGVFQESPSWIEECEWCGHPVKEHGKEGCEHDRTIYFDGIAVDAPCGCDAVITEPIPFHKPVMQSGLFWLGIACISLAVALGAWLFTVGMFSL